MKSIQFSALENELSNYNFDELIKSKDAAKANIAAAKNAADIKTEICSIWNKVRKYVTALEIIPVIGKFITIFADLLDSLCGN